MGTSKPLTDNLVKTNAQFELESLLFQRCRNALKLLFSAHNYAQIHDGNHWDFAEEIASLWHRGMMNSDLRWLVCIGFLEHGHETTKLGDERRQFQHDVGLHFPKRTCFVLTKKGAAYVRENLLESGELTVPTMSPQTQTVEIELDLSKTPTWDRDLQELRFNNKIIKRFNVPAPNQEMILAVFEEEQWPVCIDDPLPRHPDIDPKRRLRDTINSLNRNQKHELIHFGGNGSGDGVRWEIAKRNTVNEK